MLKLKLMVYGEASFKPTTNPEYKLGMNITWYDDTAKMQQIFEFEIKFTNCKELIDEQLNNAKDNRDAANAEVENIETQIKGLTSATNKINTSDSAQKIVDILASNLISDYDPTKKTNLWDSVIGSMSLEEIRELGMAIAELYPPSEDPRNPVEMSAGQIVRNLLGLELEKKRKIANGATEEELNRIQTQIETNTKEARKNII